MRLAFFAVLPGVLALWPIPTTLTTGTSILVLSSTFTITVNVPNAPQDLLDAVSRTKTYLATDNLQRLVVDRGASDAASFKASPALASLTITLQNTTSVLPIATEAVKDFSSRIEGYTLAIPNTGAPAVLSANSTLGLFRGLTTFAQLWYTWNGTVYSNVAPVNIVKDSPAYPYRGFMLDTSRNFFPVTDIKRTLDAMSWVKLNQFHWHITDSQSFPLSLPDFPELAQKGAYSVTQVYSPSDVQDIVSYAAARGIDVLMEIDTPGHTAIIAASHPEHIACSQSSPWTTFANEPPAGQLRLATPATVNFTTGLITAAAKVLPGKYFSTGGDELNTACYTQDAKTQADLKSSGQTLEKALNSFTQATHGALAKLGKNPVVWEEMVLEHTLMLSNNTVVMVWISSMNAASVASKNFRIVHAPSDYFYLDCGAGEWIGKNPTGNSWCDPFKTWQHAYTFNPLANISSSQAHLVLGGQQLLWAEQSDSSNLDSIVWPRAAISAEVFWSAKQPNGKALDGTEAQARLHDVRFRMVQRGVKAIALQPQWCALRPGLCNLDS
ncbi:Beta-hexosaminidase [Mycena indigotica]|uniref:Beta-hexosaminidase n=1 Tax=Mycena indigotica TaxID=2126181 RepID=A0A8H6VYP8_9AGAR|nr:Beta-hexosaminidase [Mycena indigotica]KAF7293004.1 Beta-hexosaminidase [Mycena indigotica]